MRRAMKDIACIVILTAWTMFVRPMVMKNGKMRDQTDAAIHDKQ